MPLPNANITWPPVEWANAYDQYYEHAAWYSGNPAQLSLYYQSRLERLFWAQEVVEQERKTMLHVPVAGDISNVSANMLFSEHPEFRIPTETNTVTADRLQEMIEQGAVYNRLLEGAELCSALGGIFLKVNWDRVLVPYPILSVTDADNAIPEFRHGILVAATFWKVVDRGIYNTNEQVRWLERHEPGVIYNALYKGNLTNIGNQMPMDSLESTRGIPDVIPTQIPGLACRYIPNMMPNRYLRSDPQGQQLGRSDYAGCTGIFDSIDRVWSSLMRDIELGLGRIIAPADYFQKDTTTGKFRFDPLQESYLHVDAVGSSEMKDNITLSQFEIRTEQHLTALKDLYAQAYSSAGYSPQTFGLDIQGKAESGTALRVREAKSFKTAAKKGEYWRSALADILEIMLMVDRLHLGNTKITPEKPQVELQDGVQQDPNEVATSVEMLNRAVAISTYQKVSAIHPDWKADTIQAEVDAILKETGMSVPPPEMV